ncbi:MAG: 16S rRNA (cytosine(1402)-N(4))-methyltransferase RsmH [Bacilli bacterium]|nr:16S rRNA (cytosine(1402)-N(4))-methyltransferase RsmH [Bacilli bacterium]MDD4077144.1 16S rRNA (cytosine(1402)-N(4))-methyltransferase RsmH [Bacilli bacterium]
MMNRQHIPVMLKEAISGLNIKPHGIYIDCTMGGGGHAAEILRRLNKDGHLYCFEHDFDILSYGRNALAQIASNYTIIPENFIHIKSKIDEIGIKEIDGILYDLGVSSFQFDIGERGFSYHIAAALDMRMNRAQSLSAYDIVNKYSYEELRNIFYQYGEEKFAPPIARRIVTEREKQPITMTTDLAEIVLKSVPPYIRRLDSHPAKKVFQALRIAVNDELNNLEVSLNDAISMLRKGGRIVVISFHSLEDRIVKQIYRKYAEPTIPRGLPIKEKDIIRNYRLVNKRVIVPSEMEISVNKRARSAKMRILEKI